MIGIGVGINRQRFAQGSSFFAAYAARVVADGGTTESGQCVDAVTGLLLNASLLLIPSGYKANKLYSQIPTNGNGDLTWARTSTANRTNSSGNIELMETGVPRLSYMYGSCPALLLESQRTNSLRNSTMQGASTSPSTLPTNWGSTLSGLTQTVVGIGTENGLPYIDVQFSGTATGTTLQMRFETTTQIVASNGQTWSSSFWIKLIAAPNPPTSYTNAISERDSGGTNLATNTQTITISATLTRNIFTRTNTNPSTTRISNAVVGGLTIGNTYDFTIRIAAPQLELGAFATTWINTTNAAATRLVDTFSRNNIYTNGLIDASGGTWYVELMNNIAYLRDTTGESLVLDDGSLNDGFYIRASSVSSRLIIGKRQSSTLTSLYTTLTDTVKIAIKWNGTSADVFVNGTKQVSATAFTTTILENLSSTGRCFPLFIQAMALYPSPLSDEDCITLTT